MIEEQEQKHKDVVSVIDADFIPFYVCHNKKGDPIKTLDDCIRITDDFINNINKTINADYYVGFLTVGKCFRYTINPDYKAKRKYDDLPPYTAEVRQHLIDNHNFTWLEGYEADDLIVSFKAQNSHFKSILVSPDKDILNLEGIHLNPRIMDFKHTNSEDAVVYFWKSMIKGDSADNIKGVPGKGSKAADACIGWADKYDEEYYKSVLEDYIDYFGEYEGIKEFTKNYLSLKLIDSVSLGEIELNKVNKEGCEQAF